MIDARTKATLSGLKNNGNLSLNICFDKIAVNLNSRRQNIDKKTFMISLLSMQTFLGVDRIPDLHVLKSGFRNLGNFLFVESGIKEYFGCGTWNPKLWNPESRIQLKESGIPQKIGIQSPSSGRQRLESGIWNPESMVWNPESNTVLNSLTRWGELYLGGNA